MTQLEQQAAAAVAGTSPGQQFVGTNWKMTLTPAEARSYLETLRGLVGDIEERRLFVLPPYPALPIAAEVLAGTKIAWGAQDVHPDDRGAHTGDVSAPMLAELGCSYVAVGHFERRRDYGETDALVIAKAAAAQRAGMTPIICVGETERLPAERALAVVSSQLEGGAGLDPERLVIAYEPGWAIGEGNSAPDPDWLTAMGDGTTEILSRLFGGPAPVIVGGSIDLALAEKLLGNPSFDGVFVGRRALDPRAFAQFAQAGR